MKVLITGARGQLGMEFRRFFEGRSSCRVLAMSKEKLDVTEPGMVKDAVQSFRPDVVINCSAYNQVDKAEEDYEKAYRVNAQGVKNLATACNVVRALLIHFSTDYVFDGEKQGLYTEQDTPNPVNKYGISKLEGEKLLFENAENYLLFRVSWVFGSGEQNFLYKLRELARNDSVLRIACDQVSVPTYTGDIVRITWKAIKEGLRNRIYHLTNTGYASRYEVAHYYFELLDRRIILLPVPSDQFRSPARRPYFSAMSNRKVSNDTGVKISHWREAMERFVRSGRRR